MSRVGLAERRATSVESLTDTALETSQIEGEVLSRPAVRSSVARRLGVPIGATHPADAQTEGVVEVTLDATHRRDEPLTADRVYSWHALLFPGRYGERQATVGRWRDDRVGPMQVVSGRIDAPTVHFEAPPADRVPLEMHAFLEWFNLRPREDGLIRSALAHLWFVTIHPFDDGNGRIARAIGDMAIAQDEHSNERFYSISRQIRIEKSAYYDILERTQRDGLDVTSWLEWFFGCYRRSIETARHTLGEVLDATKFWDAFGDVEMSARQRRVLNRLLTGFEGALTARKWAAIGKTSTDSALRDISDLLEKNVLLKNPGGSRKTSYRLATPNMS